uniref:CCHC-type domain-containing protein n=1 Tax=Cannabis sativa TaxID=3483 RepID=A0A803P0Z9_CANSA
MAVMATEVEVDDLVTLTNKFAVESEEDWEVNEEDATVGTWKVKILEVHKDHTFVKISFKNRDNIRMVLDKQPWLFGRGLLVMEEWPLFDQWVDAKLDMVCCWVRIHGVPLKLCTQANIERVAKFGGEVEEVCWSNSHQVLFNGYVYMRIGFPINRGIFVGQFVKLAGVDYWVHFKFEKLFVLCFHCGYWGHEKKDCEKEKIMKEGKDRRWVEGGRSDGIWREVDDRGEAVRYRGHMTQLPTVTKDGNENVRPKDHLGQQGNGPIVIFGENVTCVDNGLTTERRRMMADMKEMMRMRVNKKKMEGKTEMWKRRGKRVRSKGKQIQLSGKNCQGDEIAEKGLGIAGSMGRLANSGQKRKASIKNWARNLANRGTKKVQGTSLNSATMVRNYSGLDAFEKEWGGADFVFRLGVYENLVRRALTIKATDCNENDKLEYPRNWKPLDIVCFTIPYHRALVVDILVCDNGAKCNQIKRKKKNEIKGLRDNMRIWHDDKEMVRIIIERYFSQLFVALGINNDTLRGMNEVLQPKVSQAMNDELMTEFRVGEVFKAVKDMNLTKALGVDGLPALFYQKFWSKLSNDVIEVCLNVLNNGTDMSCVNNTVVTLIPKVDKP